MPTASTDLDTLVRRVDEDRWLASRFAPADVRERLIALYAVNYEIARVAETVREPGLGAIRLQWWSDALIAEADASPTHPALEALQRSGASPVAGMLSAAARAADLDAAPFQTWDALEDYVTQTSGALMHAALSACGLGQLNGQQDHFVNRAALAWAYVGLVRAAPVWTARGRSFLPSGAIEADVLTRAREAYAEAKALVRSMPAIAFPAFGYAALLPGYLSALARGERERPLLARQVRFVLASATGRI